MALRPFLCFLTWELTRIFGKYTIVGFFFVFSTYLNAGLSYTDCHQSLDNPVYLIIKGRYISAPLRGQRRVAERI